MKDNKINDKFNNKSERKNDEPDPRKVYADIIDLPHWQSPTRKHMSLYDRAAQFAPFAALTGYSEMISEEEKKSLDIK